MSYYSWFSFFYTGLACIALPYLLLAHRQARKEERALREKTQEVLEALETRLKETEDAPVHRNCSNCGLLKPKDGYGCDHIACASPELKYWEPKKEDQ